MPLYDNPPEQGGIVQTKSALLSGNVTTTATVFVDLLTVDITTGGSSRLEIYVSLATSNSISSASTGQDFFQIMVDSTVLNQGGTEQWPVTEGSAIFAVSDVLSAGAHVVHLQWKTQTGKTFRCSGGTIATQPEHASVLVIETKG